MDCAERYKLFKEKLTQVAALMEEINVLANMRYDFEHDDLFMFCNFGRNGDIYERMKEACKHYGVSVDIGKSTDAENQAQDKYKAKEGKI